MSSEQNNKRNRMDREHAPASELTQSGSETTTMVVEPFAEFGKLLAAQLLELESCFVLAGTPPRHIPNVAARRRQLR